MDFLLLLKWVQHILTFSNQNVQKSTELREMIRKFNYEIIGLLISREMESVREALIKEMWAPAHKTNESGPYALKSGPSKSYGLLIYSKKDF